MGRFCGYKGNHYKSTGGGTRVAGAVLMYESLRQRQKKGNP